MPCLKLKKSRVFALLFFLNLKARWEYGIFVYTTVGPTADSTAFPTARVPRVPASQGGGWGCWRSLVPSNHYLLTSSYVPMIPAACADRCHYSRLLSRHRACRDGGGGLLDYRGHTMPFVGLSICFSLPYCYELLLRTITITITITIPQFSIHRTRTFQPDRLTRHDPI
jgi:hypothetical protein